MKAPRVANLDGHTILRSFDFGEPDSPAVWISRVDCTDCGKWRVANNAKAMRRRGRAT